MYNTSVSKQGRLKSAEFHSVPKRATLTSGQHTRGPGERSDKEHVGVSGYHSKDRYEPSVGHEVTVHRRISRFFLE